MGATAITAIAFNGLFLLDYTPSWSLYEPLLRDLLQEGLLLHVKHRLWNLSLPAFTSSAMYTLSLQRGHLSIRVKTQRKSQINK